MVGWTNRTWVATSVEETSLEKQGQQNRMLTSHQARGKWMIPAYKGLLYVSIGSSMYMMGRLVLVRPNLRLPLAQMTDCAQEHKTWFGKN